MSGKKILYIVFLFACSVLFAQNGALEGTVKSETGEPLLGANIVLLNTSYGAASDKFGHFRISDLPYGEYRVQVSSIGYEKKTIENVNISSELTTLDVVLKQHSVQTDQIVVTAGKYAQNIQDLPVSTAVVLPDEFQRKNYLTLDNVLRHVPGVYMTLGQMSIRGSSGYSKGAGSRVLVAIDGIPMYTGDTGEIIWEMIPLLDIERIEVIKGPASSLYGSTAIGGVVNIITKKASQHPITQVESYLGYYDKPKYDEWNWDNKYRSFYGLTLTHSNRINDLGYTFSFSKLQNSSYRQNDYAQKELGYLKLSYDISPTSSLTLLSNFLIMNRGNFLYWKDSRNALVPKDEDNGAIVKSNREFFSLIYKNDLTNDFSFQIKPSYYRTHFDGIGVEVTSSTGDLFRNEVITNYKASPSLDIITGAEASYAKVSSNIFSSPYFFSVSGYSQAEYKGIENLIATVGMRYDLIKLDTLDASNAVTPRLGLNYKFSDKFIMRASIGTGFRAPTPAEVYTTAAVGGGISVKENPDLKSETSLSFEAGFKYIPSDEFNLDVALFQTEYDDFIEADLTPEASIQFINLPKARIQGMEIVNETQLTRELNLKIGYTYLWSRDIENHQAMKYRPRNMVYSTLDYNPYPYEFSLDFRYWSKVEAIDTDITQPPVELIVDGDKRVPVYVFDVNAGYNFIISNVPMKVNVNIKNLFNYYYVEMLGNIAPLRNISLSIDAYF